jgi:hypothetical protein
MKRWIVVLVVSAASAAFADPRLELEVGGGVSANCVCTLHPALTVRAGVDLADHFTPSLRMTTFALPGTDNHLWSVLAEFRAHTSGRFQVNGGVGVGLGKASFDANLDGLNANFFRVSPYVNVDGGVRLMLGRWWIGANVGGMPWQKVVSATLSVGVSPFGDGN